MALSTDIKGEVVQILKSQWDIRKTQNVPEPEAVTLGNGAMEFEGTVLYADLADSTKMVNDHPPLFSAEVFKIYLRSACRVIRANKGTITAFDGDRVMAVFIGDNSASDAAKAALQINYVVTDIINPQIRFTYPERRFELKHGIGIDSSKLVAVRTGIRGANDLVWVGRAANYAAKLSAFRHGQYSCFITEDVHSKLKVEAKYSVSIYQVPLWSHFWPSPLNVNVYGSSWKQEPI
jgi:class 3 adenylate cyclase